MKYRVHLYVTIRFVLEGVEAPSQLEAIKKAEKEILTDLNHGRMNLHEHEYADEVTGYLVDEEGDEEFLNSVSYDQDKKPITPPVTAPPVPAKFQCENCEKEWTEDECKWVTDFIQRFQRGDTFTDLECPECGALCF
jgi:hypothetical protein